SFLASRPFFSRRPPPSIHSLALHDALPISLGDDPAGAVGAGARRLRAEVLVALGEVLAKAGPDQEGIAAPHLDPLRDKYLGAQRSEEHTSELQSPDQLVCRLLLEKKKDRKQ